MRKLTIVLFVALAFAGSSTSSSADDGWTQGLWFSGGCFVGHWYYPTNIQQNGQAGPPGYRRYVDRGYSLWCVPI